MRCPLGAHAGEQREPFEVGGAELEVMLHVGIILGRVLRHRAEGIDVRRANSSTDSNMAMSLGIPAITMSRVATGGRGHSPDEWIGVEKDANVKLKRILLATILATAGLE